MQGTVLEPTRRCKKDAQARLAIRLLGQQEVVILEFDPEKENTVGCDFEDGNKFWKKLTQKLERRTRKCNRKRLTERRRGRVNSGVTSPTTQVTREADG